MVLERVDRLIPVCFNGGNCKCIQNDVQCGGGGDMAYDRST